MLVRGVAHLAGSLVEVDWVSTLDRSALTELKQLNDPVPQTGEALEATLQLDRRNARAPAG